MRITKTEAAVIARKLASKKLEEVEVAKNEFRDFISDTYLHRVPHEIKDMQKKHPEYFNTTSLIYLSAPGFGNDKYVTIRGRVIENRRGAAILDIDGELASKARRLKNKADSLDGSYKDLINELEAALTGLSTYSRIKEHFPEAAPHLPNKSKLEIAIRFDDLRKKIA